VSTADGPVLFVSDLHLDPQAPEGIERFRRFCRGPAREAAALYVLGDLFELWIGDDCDDEAARAVRGALSELAETGVAVALMHGNRDFLMGERLAADCGAVLLPDPTAIDLGGRRALLSHGDALCTGDAEYMAMRAHFRSEAFAEDLLARSLAERAAFGAEVRRRSREANENKPSNIMDVTPAEVDALLDGEGADLLIHGHTHRPDVHRWQHEGRTRTRIVLGDWGETTRYARASGPDVELIAWP
jgi:UDP-2,3-diacylglucosamine hydrolase